MLVQDSTLFYEIHEKMATSNQDAGSFSRWETYRKSADRGDFDEHGVGIPGYGPRDD